MRHRRRRRRSMPRLNALSRAFNDLSSQHLEFERCEVSGYGDRANASCNGRAAFAPKVGTPVSMRRQWRFKLRRADGLWTIESTDVR
jgi:hypothetical protein